MVSVVIPIYNPGDKLLSCLKCLSRQTYQQIEFIMVNDGSSDGSECICRKFAESDDRFVYINQENQGVSSARNHGLRSAKGDFVCFVDSDDSVEPDYVLCMVEAQRSCQADIVVQGLTNVYNGVGREKKIFPHLNIKSTDLDDSLFEELFFFCGPYCKLFRIDIIRKYGLFFPEDLAYGEDFAFYAHYLYHCRQFAFVSQCFYNYSVAVAGSLSSKRLQPEKFWANQLNRRRSYVELRKKYGIERDFYPTENRNKLIALRGLLSSIRYYRADLQFYLNEIKKSRDFQLSAIRPITICDFVIIYLIKMNNILSRFMLSTFIQL